MPSLDWNRKWQQMITGFEPSEEEPHFGDRWGDPDSFAPLLEVRRRFVEPYVRPGLDVLEIGPGGGRFTQFLVGARRLIVVDLNPAACEYVRQRFPGAPIEGRTTRGYDLPDVDDASLDLVFTFDCFVHVEPEGILAYLHEIERVLRPGGRAVVHYGDIEKPIARENPGFSRMTRARMDELIAETGLEVLEHDTEIMFHSNLVALARPAVPSA